MKRSPIKRHTWMKRGKKPIKPRSEKRIEEDEEYHDVVDEIVEERGTRCQFETEAEGRCTRNYDDPHHVLTQARSRRHSDRIDKRNIKLLCRAHHDWIETHREWALANGWLRKAHPSD
jgi:hypothetical protein